MLETFRFQQFELRWFADNRLTIFYFDVEKPSCEWTEIDKRK